MKIIKGILSDSGNLFKAQFNSIQSIQFNSVQFNSIQVTSVQFNSGQVSSIQFDSIWFDLIRFDSIHRYKGRLQNLTAGWPAVPSCSGRLPLFRSIETGQSRTEPPVNWPLGFEVVPKQNKLIFKISMDYNFVFTSYVYYIPLSKFTSLIPPGLSFQFIAGHPVDMELVHTSVRPTLLMLGDHRTLNLNVIARLHSLTKLFPHAFNEKLCEQMLVSTVL